MTRLGREFAPTLIPSGRDHAAAMERLLDRVRLEIHVRDIEMDPSRKAGLDRLLCPHFGEQAPDLRRVLELSAALADDLVDPGAELLVPRRLQDVEDAIEKILVG